jgi:hypothetical protein
MPHLKLEIIKNVFNIMINWWILVWINVQVTICYLRKALLQFKRKKIFSLVCKNFNKLDMFTLVKYNQAYTLL